MNTIFQEIASWKRSKIASNYSMFIIHQKAIHTNSGNGLGNFDQELDTWRSDSDTLVTATDGSLVQGCGIAGFVLDKLTSTWTVPATSSFEAEAHALAGLFRQLNLTTTTKRVVVLVDNAAVITSILDTSIKDQQFIAIMATSHLRTWLEDDPRSTTHYLVVS